VWQGKLFFAPGLQGWVEHGELENRNGTKKALPESTPAAVLTEMDVRGIAQRRHPYPDGSYERNSQAPNGGRD